MKRAWPCACRIRARSNCARRRRHSDAQNLERISAAVGRKRCKAIRCGSSARRSFVSGQGPGHHHRRGRDQGCGSVAYRSRATGSWRRSQAQTTAPATTARRGSPRRSARAICVRRHCSSGRRCRPRTSACRRCRREPDQVASGAHSWFFEALVLGPHAPGYRPHDSALRGCSIPTTRPGASPPASAARDADAAFAGRGAELPLRRSMRRCSTSSARPMPTTSRPRRHGSNSVCSTSSNTRNRLLTDALALLALNPLAPALRAGRRRQSRAEAGWWHTGRRGHDRPRRQRVRLRQRDAAASRDAAALRGFGHRPGHQRQYQAFVDDGGYRRPSLWLSDGWAMVQAQGWAGRPTGAAASPSGCGEAPRIGVGTGAAPELLHEAAAYAEWAGARLPTELSGEAAAALSAPPAALRPWPGNGRAHPTTLPASARGRRRRDYNGKFMVGQIVLRGSSLATPPGHARRSYHNFFPAGGARGNSAACGWPGCRALRPSPTSWPACARATRGGAQVVLRRGRFAALRAHLRAARVLPTRTELALLDRHAPELAECIGADAEIVEFGAGASLKGAPAALGAAAAGGLRAGGHLGRARPKPPSGCAPSIQGRSCGRSSATTPSRACAAAARRPARRLLPGSSIGNFEAAVGRAAAGALPSLAAGWRAAGRRGLVKSPAAARGNDAQGRDGRLQPEPAGARNRELGADFERERALPVAAASRCGQPLCSAGARLGGVRFPSTKARHPPITAWPDSQALARRAGWAPRRVDRWRAASLHWLQPASTEP